ncbi:MAG: hypothetical protein D6E12_17720 [Desulfovibrio sp.]|nr:MAG: hypothetical protein D6E12_17720 [Desulfovibrio sp.]
MIVEFSDNLQLRLKNCLQTILELEPDLERLELGHVLLKEYEQLKTFIEKVGTVRLEEDDVQRIEKATATFLDELKAPLSLVSEAKARKRLMQ